MLRTLLILLAVALFIYLTIAVVVYMKQEEILYHPTRELETTPEDHGMPYESVTLTTTDSVRIHGWWIPVANARGTLLFCHGNGGNISHRIESFRIFQRLGLDIFIFDYRGYGQSEGKPDEEGTYRDGEAAWRYLVEERRVDPRRLVLFGRSLGGAIASYLAEHHGGAGLILESTFRSVPDLGQEMFPWLPVRALVTYEYNTADRLSRIAIPILVAHSPGDEMIPYSHGRRLYELAREPKQFLEMRGGHNDGFIVSGKEYVAGLETFLSGVLR
jgi:uncharacterized protein